MSEDEGSAADDRLLVETKCSARTTVAMRGKRGEKETCLYCSLNKE